MVSVETDDNPRAYARAESTALRLAAAALLRDGFDTGDPARPFLVGGCAAVNGLAARLDAIASSNAPVLLTGEPGTGKELFARAIHHRGPRARRPFITVNCGAFPESLLEAELFGCERGASTTGALRRREGRVHAADGGTLFIDALDKMSVAIQARLLSVVQGGRYEALGSSAPEHVDVRVISATSRDLQTIIDAGEFSRELYQRVRSLELHLPALRDRRQDLPALVWLFLDRLAPDNTRPRLGAGVWDALLAYDFPGNLRELEHALQHAVVMSRGGTIDLAHLPRELQPPVPRVLPTTPALATLREALGIAERAHIVRALGLHAGRKTPTAQALGVSRKCLWEKIRAHQIAPDEWAPSDAAAPAVVKPTDFGVLLVEDNPADARIVCELLSESTEPRYVVRQVSRLVEVGRSLDDSKPDVILLDLQLPDSAGLATVEHVRALDSDVAIVVLTGAWEPGLERGALRGGADVMVSKDHVDASSLARVLDYAVAQRRRLYGSARQRS